MLLIATLVALALFIGIGWVTALATAGRSSIPARERVPVRSWSRADVVGNARFGARTLGDMGRHTG